MTDGQTPSTGDQAAAMDAEMATSDTPASDSAATNSAATDAEMAAADGAAADTSNAGADNEPAMAQPATPASDDSQDFGTDADVMNDSFESHEAAPPEWPAADF